MAEARQRKLEELAEQNINPQEVGQVIVHLQEEIKIIKLQLENLPGYDIGKSTLSAQNFASENHFSSVILNLCFAVLKVRYLRTWWSWK